jgi:hypothetical protein
VADHAEVVFFTRFIESLDGSREEARPLENHGFAGAVMAVEQVERHFPGTERCGFS